MRRYDCKADLLLPEESLPEKDVLILEGSYCNLPEIRRYADVRIFLNTIAGAFDTMKSAGIDAQLEKTETTDAFVYEIRIPKNAAYKDAAP